MMGQRLKRMFPVLCAAAILSCCGQAVPENHAPSGESVPGIAIINADMEPFLDELANPETPVLYFAGEGMDDVHYIEDNAETREAFRRILTENPSEEIPILQEDTLEKAMENGYYELALSAGAEKGNPASGQPVYCDVYRLGPESPEWPEKTYVSINAVNVDGKESGFLYGGDLYGQVAAYFDRYRKESHVELEGAHRLLRPDIDRDRLWEYRDILESEGRLLVHMSGGETAQIDRVQAFDLSTGESLYCYDTGSRGKLYRMEKSYEMPGYDYRLFFERSLLYKNSADPKLELEASLPDTVKPAPFPGRGEFDVRRGQITWTTQEGIWLADQDGGGARMIFDNGSLPEAVTGGESAGKDAYRYQEPRFLCGGAKIAAGAFSISDPGCAEVMVYETAAGEVRGYLGERFYSAIRYPLNDRVMISGSNDTLIADAQTGEVRAAIAGIWNMTWDGRRGVAMRYEWDARRGASAYLYDLEGDTAPRRLLRAGKYTGLMGAGMTERYAAFHGEDIDGPWLAVTDCGIAEEAKQNG